MDNYIIAEVNAKNQFVVRGQLTLDRDDLSSVVGSGRTSDVHAIYNYQIQSNFVMLKQPEVDNSTHFVAKIWRDVPITHEQSEKLRYMVRNKFTYQSTSYVIWPEYVLLATTPSPRNTSDDVQSSETVHLHDRHEDELEKLMKDKEIIYDNGNLDNELEMFMKLNKFTVGEEIIYDDSAMIVGYIMPRVLGASPLYKLMDPSERALLPLEYKDSRFLYHVAMNMARAFYVIHKQHHIMGDTNPTNILVTSDGEVILIDCDSFQIQRNSTEFYAADRRSSSSNTTLEVSTASDLINMAVLIFQLLMQGAHPFAGRNRNSISKSKEMRAQRIFIFDHPAYKPIDGTPSFNCLPESLRSLFVDAFTNQPHNPPSAVDWVKTLKSVSSQLVQCSVDHNHYHVKEHLCAECEWQKGRLTTPVDESI